MPTSAPANVATADLYAQRSLLEVIVKLQVEDVRDDALYRDKVHTYTGLGCMSS